MSHPHEAGLVRRCSICRRTTDLCVVCQNTVESKHLYCPNCGTVSRKTGFYCLRCAGTLSSPQKKQVRKQFFLQRVLNRLRGPAPCIISLVLLFGAGLFSTAPEHSVLFGFLLLTGLSVLSIYLVGEIYHAIWVKWLVRGRQKSEPKTSYRTSSRPYQYYGDTNRESSLMEDPFDPAMLGVEFCDVDILNPGEDTDKEDDMSRFFTGERGSGGGGGGSGTENGEEIGAHIQAMAGQKASRAPSLPGATVGEEDETRTIIQNLIQEGVIEAREGEVGEAKELLERARGLAESTGYIPLLSLVERILADLERGDSIE